MSGFANAILGGAANLIRKAIQSPNYSPGVEGWSINKDGTAEFANAVIRGTIKTGDTQYILIESGPDGNKIQFFSGSPDEVSPGFVMVDQPVAGQATLTVQAPDLGFGSPPALTLTSGPLETDNNADLSSPYSLSHNAEILSAFFSQLYDLTAARINLTATGVDGINLDGGPGGINAQLLNANGGIVLPVGEYIKRGGLGTPTFGTGWGAFGGGFQAPRYIEYPDRTAGLVGVASGTPATGGTTILSFPAALAPASQQTFFGTCNTGLKTQLLITPAGNCVLQNPDAGVTWVSLQAARWPMVGF
ncbi:hypothetical protein GCM10009527_097950 [Actinomadura nitritigenes]|uniref:Tip attachment protein J central straight fiber domain-containing protein n=1 Tax=Actinomadura nitritigenes TaxID=134602 RepID=A0ABS3QWC8_9ACTN|nr:hypothetical protein [Actinomadura nitritigenes]MBO2438281.1 hypothetical protein [Actinomadura nitritigenes]